MKVLLLAEQAPGALGYSYASAFRSMGFEVESICLRSAGELDFPGLRWRGMRRLMHPLAAGLANRRIRETVKGRADLVLVVKGEQFSAETIAMIRDRTGAVVVNFFPDDPFSDVRSNRLVYGPEVLAAYDICFTFARHLIPSYTASGARRVEYLPFARDPEMHSPVEGVEDPEFDVVFAGNLDSGRVAWLESLRGFRIALFGERTKEAIPVGSALHSATTFPAVYGMELARAVARAAISINIMRPQNQGSHNMRSFESPACGAFTLSQRTPELVELFREGEEIACFGSGDELKEQVDRWLSSPNERRAVAAAGFERVREDTYQARATSILRFVGIPS